MFHGPHSPDKRSRRRATGRPAIIAGRQTCPCRAALSLPFRTPLSANLMLISYTGVKSGKGRTSSP